MCFHVATFEVLQFGKLPEMTVIKNECWGENRKNSQAPKLNGILSNTIPTWRKLEANCVETK